jgi:hypothetical protein
MTIPTGNNVRITTLKLTDNVVKESAYRCLGDTEKGIIDDVDGRNLYLLKFQSKQTACEC